MILITIIIMMLWTSRQSGHRTRQSGAAQFEGIAQPVSASKTDVKPMTMMTVMTMMMVMMWNTMCIYNVYIQCLDMQSYRVTQCIDDYIHIGPRPNNTPEMQTFIIYHYKEIHWYEYESICKHRIVMVLNYDTWRQVKSGIYAWHQMTQLRTTFRIDQP